MNYAATYNALMQRARGREIVGYTEKHHVLPRCMGGTNNSENIVRLTAREHFLAHRLLTRIYPTVRGVWYALIAMGRLSEMRSRIFSSEREKAALLRRGTRFSLESRRRMSKAKKGKPSVSPSTCFKKGVPSWSKGRTGKDAPGYGKKRTAEQRERMGMAQRACGNRPPSRKGARWTEEQKARARIRRMEFKQVEGVL